MTAKQAKDLSLEVWRYLRDHPEIQRKRYLPDKIYSKIGLMICECPLCEYYCQVSCSHCILDSECSSDGSYEKWLKAKTKKTRAKYADKFVKKIESWEI